MLTGRIVIHGVAVVLLGCTNPVEEAREEGYAAGYEDGKSEGHDEGRQEVLDCVEGVYGSAEDAYDECG